MIGRHHTVVLLACLGIRDRHLKPNGDRGLFSKGNRELALNGGFHYHIGHRWWTAGASFADRSE